MDERKTDIWITIIQQEIDKCQKWLDENNFEDNNYKYGLVKGKLEGLCESWTWQNIVSEGKRFKSRIAEIENELDNDTK